MTRDQFIAVCSCGWQSPPQRTAGLAGASLDAHRRSAGGAPAAEGGAGPAGPDAEGDDRAGLSG